MSKKNRRRALAAQRHVEVDEDMLEADEDVLETDEVALVEEPGSEVAEAEADEVAAAEAEELDLAEPDDARVEPVARPQRVEEEEEEWPALVALGLTKSYGDVPALLPLDLTVEAGQSVALIGHNGSGKSTFLRMAAGLLEITDGEVEVAGWPVGTVPARATTSYLPDEPVLYDDLSVREHIEYVSRLYGGDGYDAYAEDIVRRLGLIDRVDELPARFSRGLRQKAAIVLALSRPFSVLLVDEPFVGLDATGRATMLELLSEVHRDGAAVVVATHEPTFVEQVERCVALRDGELIFDGVANVDRVLKLVSV